MKPSYFLGASGSALVTALLLCLAVDSPTMWWATWAVIIVFAVVMLITGLVAMATRYADKQAAEIRERLRGL